MEIRPITSQQFRHFQNLIQNEVGIHLSDMKHALLARRLSGRLKELNLDSYGDYYEQVRKSGTELQQMLNCLCTKETQFFREPSQYDFIRKTVLPEWRNKAASGVMSRNVRAWCAACSTGEEPYTLAMILLEGLPEAEGWKIEILATDISTKALKHAEQATWHAEKASSIPDNYLKRFCLTGVDSLTVKMGPEIRSVVRFDKQNLIETPYPVPGKFRILFCRNVLLYFGLDDRKRVVENLLHRLEPKGFFFIGQPESLTAMSAPARLVRPAIYQKNARPSGGRH